LVRWQVADVLVGQRLDDLADAVSQPRALDPGGTIDLFKRPQFGRRTGERMVYGLAAAVRLSGEWSSTLACTCSTAALTTPLELS